MSRFGTILREYLVWAWGLIAGVVLGALVLRTIASPNVSFGQADDPFGATTVAIILIVVVVLLVVHFAVSQKRL